MLNLTEKLIDKLIELDIKNMKKSMKNKEVFYIQDYPKQEYLEPYIYENGKGEIIIAGEYDGDNNDYS